MTDPVINSSEQEQYPDSQEKTSVRKVVLLIVLLLLLALIAFSTYYFMKNRRLPIPRLTTEASRELVAPPEYVFSISGPAGADALTRPVGVTVSGDRVYASDNQAMTVRVYDLAGNYQFSFNAVQDGEFTELGTPQHMSTGPDGNVYVSDRRLRAVFVFTPEGEYVRKAFLEPEEEGTWSPLGTGFDSEGNLWAADVGISGKHRIVSFDQQGNEIRRFGQTVQVTQMSDAPGGFYFPNAVVFADDGRLFISDSNNRRIQVYNAEGQFDYFIRTSGIPRGLAIDDEDRLYVVDALAHTTDVYTLKGERITSFGGSGRGPGQFRYSNTIALDANGRIYLTDRVNHQIQVWEWPTDDFVVPGLPEKPWEWALCLSPLLLLPLLLLLRRRRYAVTEDFVDAMSEAEKVDLMDRRKTRWVTPEHMHDVFVGRTEQDVDLGELIHAQEFSDSDARDLVSRFDIEYDDAAVLVVAKRAKRLCTEDARLAALARRLDVDVLDRAEFLRRFDKTDKVDDAG